MDHEGIGPRHGRAVEETGEGPADAVGRGEDGEDRARPGDVAAAERHREGRGAEVGRAGRLERVVLQFAVDPDRERRAGVEGDGAGLEGGRRAGHVGLDGGIGLGRSGRDRAGAAEGHAVGDRHRAAAGDRAVDGQAARAVPGQAVGAGVHRAGEDQRAGVEGDGRVLAQGDLAPPKVFDPPRFSSAMGLEESSVRALATVIPLLSWSEAGSSTVAVPVPRAEPSVTRTVPSEIVVPPP